MDIGVDIFLENNFWTLPSPLPHPINFVHGSKMTLILNVKLWPQRSAP